ncbi:hypothetical protein BU17DRAFT_46311 [Hysterangium stoloniferum]|nr:hypothetical protein BU17DRAFT_46311 [Hysterangium stoloniferum]
MFTRRPIVLITGSSRVSNILLCTIRRRRARSNRGLQGLGRALCREFHTHGFRVFATARDLTSIEGLQSEGCDILQLDVTHLDSINHAARVLSIKTGGRLDILVNNAAVCTTLSPSIMQDHEELITTVATNLIGPALVAQAFVPLIIGSNGGKGGLVINIGSGEGIAAAPWLGMYSACKSGLGALSSTWRMELKNFGVRVMHVVPGAIATAMLNSSVAPGITENIESAGTLYQNWRAIDTHRQNITRLFPCTTPDDTAKEIVEAAGNSDPPRTLYCGA